MFGSYCGPAALAIASSVSLEAATTTLSTIIRRRGGKARASTRLDDMKAALRQLGWKPTQLRMKGRLSTALPSIQSGRPAIILITGHWLAFHPSTGLADNLGKIDSHRFSILGKQSIHFLIVLFPLNP